MLALLGIVVVAHDGSVVADEYCCCCSRSSRIFRDESTMSFIAGVANAAPNAGDDDAPNSDGADPVANAGGADAMQPKKFTDEARCWEWELMPARMLERPVRSEERRVGKECLL